MAQQDLTKHVLDESLGSPIERFNATRLVKKETVLKHEIESYYISDVDNIAFIRYGKRRLNICQTLDLPDAMCDGLTYKQRLICTDKGDCLLLARWKPERHMRRNAPDWSQRWFVEKQLYPPDTEKMFTRLEKRFQPLSDSEAASPPLVAAETDREPEGTVSVAETADSEEGEAEE
jgi:hypothetical protein